MRKQILCLSSALFGLFLLPCLVPAAYDLYWTESDRIMGSDIDGENVAVVFDGSEAMAGIAVDILVTGDHIYWTDHPGGTAAAIWRAGRDGSNPEKIAEFGDFRAPHFFALDEPNGHIYFTDFERGIFRIDLDGGDEEWVFNGRDAFPAAANHTGIYLRGPGDPVFLSTGFTVYEPGGDEFATWATAIANLPGSGATYGVALDEATQTLYYTTHTGGQLRSYNLGTGEGQLLRMGLSQPLGVKLSPSKSHLLIAERGRGVSAFQIDNFGYELLVHSPAAHFGVAVAADPENLPPGEDPADFEWLFRANFEEDTPGEPPFANWGVAVTTEGTITVLEDEENVFGDGTDNQFLRVESAQGLDIRGDFEANEVITLAFDYIGRVNEGDGNRWLNVFLRQGTPRAHITSIRIPALSVRRDEGADLTAGPNNIPLRFDTVMNNSNATVNYDTPDGGTAELAPGMVSLWIYNYLEEEWTQLYEEYNYERNLGQGEPLNNILFQFDTRTPPVLRSFDLDNVYVFEGASVGRLLREADIQLPDIPYPEEPELIVHEDFMSTPVGEITSAEDYQGPFTLSRLQHPTLGGGPAFIVLDEQNWFGRGTDNHILYWDEALDFRLDLVDELESGVATVAFDMYHEGEFHPDQNRFGARFYGLDLLLPSIVNNFGFQVDNRDEGTYFLRGPEKVIKPFYLQRWVVITNNTRETITYDSPLGQQELGPGLTQLWLNGVPFRGPYSFGASATEQVIRSFRFDAFNRWTAYFDNIRVWEGAIVPETDPLPDRPVDPESRDLLVYEGFDYAEGTLLGNDGGIGWAEPYGPFLDWDSAEVVSPGLDWPDLDTIGNRVVASGPEPNNATGTRNFRVMDIAGMPTGVLDPHRGWTRVQPESGSIWLSVLAEGNPGQGSGFFWGLSLYRDTSAQTGEVLFLGKGSADTEVWRFTGGGGSATGGDSTALIDAGLEEKYFWVIRIDYNAEGSDVAHLFQNPDPAGATPTSPVATIEVPLLSGSYGFDRIRIAGNGAGMSVDELRIGATWQAVSGSDVEPGEGYMAWAESYFPGETDPAIVGPDANPAGDGILNLVKYALGLDPTVASRDGLPALGFETIGDDDYLTLAFSSPDDVDDVFYTVVVGSDLVDLDGLAEHVSSTPDPERTGHSIHVYRDTEPVTANDRRFIRLSVDLQ